MENEHVNAQTYNHLLLAIVFKLDLNPEFGRGSIGYQQRNDVTQTNDYLQLLDKYKFLFHQSTIAHTPASAPEFYLLGICGGSKTKTEFRARSQPIFAG